MGVIGVVVNNGGNTSPVSFVWVIDVWGITLCTPTETQYFIHGF